MHHPLCDGLFIPGKGSKKRTTMNKKHWIFNKLYSLYIEKYGQPLISMRQLLTMRKNRRRDSDARRKRKEKQNSNGEGDDDYEEESDPDDTEDDEDYDYFEPDEETEVTGV